MQNKRTIYVRSVLTEAAERIGGVDRLVQWIKEAPENERLFWSSMYMRLLPVQVRGTGPSGEVVLEIKKEELTKRLEERGLPTRFFGRDVPVLELEAEPTKGNGHDEQARTEGAAPPGSKGNGGAEG